MSTPSQAKLASGVSVRPMREADLTAAREICRVAFGTFLGAPNPSTFWPDRDYIVTRWRTDPTSAFAAEVQGALAGSNFATNWGSFGFFGPLTIRPELWNKGVAQSLLGPTMDLMFQKWGTLEAGLFTFAQSTGHIHLYQKFGFWPRFLTAIMSKPIESGARATISKYSAANPTDREAALKACRSLTNAIFEGLDVSREIQGIEEQKIGETVLLWGGDTLEGFAVCHCGAGTEAGADACYVKFAAAKPGPNAGRTFERLLDACAALGAERGLKRLDAGVNLARSLAYRDMLRHGFRTQFQGVAMQRPDSPAYNRADVYVVDDWR
jgi:RimJ/RimL family protein N-acetyltransferase